MRNELELMQQIEKYLLNKMDDAEKKSFETEMNTDAGLKAAVEKQRLLTKGVNRLAAKQSISTSAKKYFLKKNIFKWGLGGAGLLATGLVVLMNGHNPFATSQNTDPYKLPEVNENNEKVWADADRYLPAQVFSIDNSKDTLVQTADGILFAIPANCFLDKNGKPVKGNVDLNIKEALKPEEIIKAGLDTRSDGKLLESGGMFYINPTLNGENLKIDPAKGIYTEVPQNKKKDGMQLYEGQRMPDGSINWINPKPTEKFLTPVDIFSLNFYPPLYLDSLKRMGYNIKDKKFTDSLYYSYASYFGNAVVSLDIAMSDTIQRPQVGREEAAIIFRKNCSRCHTHTDLAGVQDRVPQPAREWLKAFIGDNKKVLKSGDAYAQKIFDENGKKNMDVFGLKPEEMDALVNYLYSFSAEKDSATSDISSYRGINPAKIKAIWSDKFQNTLIATKEFEQRLRLIFKSCNERLLDLYINNIDKKMSTIDSMAAKFETNVSGDFLQLARQNMGRVKIKEGHMKKLQEYYLRTAQIETEAIAKTTKKFWDEQNNLNVESINKQNDHSTEEYKRVQQNFAKELDMNMNEAYRQLGKKRPVAVPGNSVGATIIGPGWYNVDKAVWESTVTRTTLNYTDPESGKKAIIKYLPFSLNTDRTDFDRITVYLLPDSLYSFMRVKREGNSFTENLNELMHYDLIAVAYKGDQSFYFDAKDVKPGNLTAKWAEISEDDLVKKISSVRKAEIGQKILDDAKFENFMVTDTKRQEQNVKRSDLKKRILPVVLPCYPWDENTYLESRDDI